MADDQIRDPVEADLEAFSELISSRDDVTPSMLRTHLATENLLERILVASLPGGHGLIENGNLTYAQKLEVVNALKITESSLIGSLRQLNKVRNAASHSKEGAITRAEIEKIGMPLGPRFIEIRQKHASNYENFALTTLATVFARTLNIVHVSEQKASKSGGLGFSVEGET